MGFLTFLFIVALITLTVLACMASDGTLGKNKLHNKAVAREDAEIVSIEPKRYGRKGASHFEAVITFSDGTWYRTDCDWRKSMGLTMFQFGFDKSKVPDAVERAKAAHDDAVMKALKKERGSTSNQQTITDAKSHQEPTNNTCETSAVNQYPPVNNAPVDNKSIDSSDIQPRPTKQTTIRHDQVDNSIVQDQQKKQASINNDSQDHTSSVQNKAYHNNSVSNKNHLQPLKTLPVKSESKTSVCPRCQASIPNGSTYCYKCGNKIDLIFCHECDQQVSASAEACPNCGYPIKNVLRPIKTAVETQPLTANKIFVANFLDPMGDQNFEDMMDGIEGRGLWYKEEIKARNDQEREYYLSRLDEETQELYFMRMYENGTAVTYCCDKATFINAYNKLKAI